VRIPGNRKGDWTKVQSLLFTGFKDAIVAALQNLIKNPGNPENPYNPGYFCPTQD
jgi:hypothetical protein